MNEMGVGPNETRMINKKTGVVRVFGTRTASSLSSNWRPMTVKEFQELQRRQQPKATAPASK